MELLARAQCGAWNGTLGFYSRMVVIPSWGCLDTAETGTTYSDEYHVFSLEWSQDTLTWLMNDEPYFNLITGEHASLQSETPFNDPFFFIFNIAVGGNWPGYPDECTLFPQFMAVDYEGVPRTVTH